MGYKLINVDIDDLVVNKKNPRYEEVENEYEAIKNIMRSQQDKLLKLIEHILDNGLNPSELVIVVKERTKYLVLEGNRRVTAIKLINDLDRYADIDSKFANKLSVVFSKKNACSISNINVIAFESSLNANRWIRIKHTGENSGVGVLGWSRDRKELFMKETAKDDKVINVLKYVRDSKYYSDDLKIKLGDLKHSNLSKLLGDPHVRETIGLTLRSKKLYRVVSEEDLSKGLSKILYDTLNGVFKKRNINTKENRLAYIEGFTEEHLPSMKNKCGGVNLIREEQEPYIAYDNKQLSLNDFKNIDTVNVTKNETGREKISLKLSSKVNRGNRKFLIPSDYNIRINDKGIASVYKELKTLDVKRYYNSVGMLFRVFLEKLVMNYIKFNKDKLIIDKDYSFVALINFVVNDLRQQEKITLEDEAFVEEFINDGNFIFKSNTLKEYIAYDVRTFNVVKLIESWDLLEPIIKEMLFISNLNF